MNILFIHQNFPGQFLRLARYLKDVEGHTVYALGEADRIKKRGTLAGITTVGYPSPAPAGPQTHHYLQSTEAAVRRGQVAARALLNMKNQGMKPDIIYAHPGWGEALFIRDIFPDTPILMFCEFYFSPTEADQGFDPEFPVSADWSLSVRMRNAPQAMSLLTANARLSPTKWQASRYPELFRQGMHIAHDGIDTTFMRPSADDSLTLQPLPSPGESRVIAIQDERFPFEPPLGQAPKAPPLCLTAKDKVITYVSRNLEPYRGFHIFMRSLAAVQQEHPDAHILIVGGDGSSYSPLPPQGKSYKATYLDEVRDSLDLSHVHFLGRIPYSALRALFRISSAHVYLTYPFVLSWSVLEAMSCESLVIASATAPVQEAITDQKNGILTDFFDTKALSRHICSALANPQEYMSMRQNARKHIVEEYECLTCLQRHSALLSSLL